MALNSTTPNYLEEEQKRLRSAPKTDLQQRTAAGLKENWEGFKRGMDPRRGGESAPASAPPASLGIGGLRPAHTPGAAIAAATPQQQPQVGTAPAAARENLAVTTTAPTSTPAYPVAPQPPVAGPTSMITTGTQGHDGYGMVKRVPSGGSGAIGTDRMGTGQVGGYSFRGTGADFAKFAQQPTTPALQDGNTVASEPAAYLGVRDRYDAARAAQENLAGLDPRSGWGWKGRQELYKHQQGLDQRANEEQTRAQIEAARLLSGQQQNQAQLAEQQRQFDEQAPLRQAETEAKQLEAGYSRQKNELAQRWQQATDPKEKEALYRQMLGLEGKEPRSNIETVDVPNPDDPTGGTMKVPARINPDGTYTRLQEQGGQQQAAQAPQSAIDYLKKNPGQAAAFKQKYGYLPPGF